MVAAEGSRRTWSSCYSGRDDRCNRLKVAERRDLRPCEREAPHVAPRLSSASRRHKPASERYPRQCERTARRTGRLQPCGSTQTSSVPTRAETAASGYTQPPSSSV